MTSVVETRLGKLRGEFERSVLAFRGIPFARAPVGELRFRPPAPPEPWGGVRDATRFGPAAPQTPYPLLIVRRMVGALAEQQSQDCLYLNVWTPAADAGRRPVLVWLHGGGFMMGAGSTFLYRGARLAERGNAVVVTINYRLGALGFLNEPGLRERSDGVASNLGIRDQITALEWVRDNVEAFGGDPRNVTVFGESAGAMSLGTLLAVPRARGLFQRAILQSGAAHNVSSETHGGRVASLFFMKLGTSDPAQLREARVSEILRAQRETAFELGFRSGAMPWQPSVDGELIPDSPLRALEMGTATRVPLLVGTNRDEFRLFMLADAVLPRLDEEEVERRAGRMFGNADRGARAVHVYRASGRGRGVAGRLLEAMMSDRIFHYPAQRLADLNSASGAPTYRYLFTWSPPFTRERLGACHGIEIPFVFGTLRDRALRLLLGASRGARSLSSRMMDAWLAFARSGHPGTERLPEWRPYEPRARATLELGAKSAMIEAPFAQECAVWQDREAQESNRN